MRLANLEKDTLEPDYTSILSWNVTIHDSANIMENGGPSFSIDWYDEADRKYKPVFFDDDQRSSTLLHWLTKDGTTTVNGPVLVKAMPGKYRINMIELRWNYTPTRGYSYIDIYVDKEFTLTAGQAHYIGSFDITVARSQNNHFSTNFTIRQNEDELRAAYAVFKSKFPNLAAQFRDNVFLTYVTSIEPRGYSKPVFEENFANNADGWTITKGPKSEAFFENGMYVVESIKNKFTYSTITYDKYLPDDRYDIDCDIELVSAWQSGRNDMAFGLLVGSNLRQGRPLNYFFAVSKNGKAAVYENRGDNFTRIMPWVEVKSLRGAKDVRQLVETSPDGSAYFVNGEYVGRVKTYLPDVGSTRLGVVVGEKQEVGFKHLIVSGP